MEALLESLVNSLNSPIQEKLGLLCGIETEIQKLSSLLSTTKAVIEDAEQKQFTDKAIQLWLQKLNLIAYEVDDILDDYATEVSREPKCNNICCNVLDCLPATSNIWFPHRIGARMKKIIGKFDAVADERIKLGLSNHFLVDSTAIREIGSLLNEPDLVHGRDEEIGEIVKTLVNHIRDNQNVSVLPIVGVGGLGKTTLAQLVFNDESIAKHFEPKLWVSVPEDFNVKRIIKALIESVEKASIGDLPLNALQIILRSLLEGKRYLIVLDDVWNENPEEWEKLKSVLECGSKGSSIVTTTRMEKVATIMGTLQTYYLSSLSYDQCWSLFRQRAFGPQEAEEYPNLVVIGQEIVQKCGGVPLAAKVLGGFLRFKRQENEWNSVKCSEIWNLPQDTTDILPALRLSYLNLPAESRGCFAYCAAFPKGYEFEIEEVIHLWMANGLLSSNETMEVEDVGVAVLTELYDRSLFQAVKEDEFFNALTFKMHDLVHDLARSVMKAKHGGTESIRTIRHLALDFPYDEQIVAFPTKRRDTDQYSSFLSKYGSLRVLIVRTAWWEKRFSELPPAVSKLTHLRHVNLSGSHIVELPNSICGLWNLQILNLNDCEHLRSLPKGMRFLRNLRHLCLRGCWNLTHMPSGIGGLSCLRTLSMVVLGGKKGFQLSELRGLNMLRGELSIRHLERVEDKKDAEEARLIEKKRLRRLCLYFNWDSERTLQRYNDEEVLDEEVLEALKPCPDLQSLHIEGFNGSSFPSWISTVTTVSVVNSAPEYIVGAQESTATTATDNPKGMLKALVWDMPNLKGMLRREVQGTPAIFSQLQYLSFVDCPTLMLPLPRMPSLKELDVNMCPNMAWASISNLTSLNSLEVGNIEGLSCFPEEMLQNLSLLESLKIKQMKDLRALPRSLASLTALKTLTIKQCPKLGSLPKEHHLFHCFNLVSLSMGTKALKSLTHLSIQGSNTTALPEELKYFPAPQKLELENFRNLTSLPDWFGDHLTPLQHLELHNCPKHEKLPSSSQMMTTLQSLTVRECPELESLPEEGLRGLASLQELSLFGCYNLVSLSMGTKALRSLTRLCIYGSKATALPEEVKHLAALQELELQNFRHLTSLPDWFGDHLTSLQDLTLRFCPKLETLPSSIQMMTALQSLTIGNCDLLGPRCERRGEEWHKIKHIWNVKIDGRILSTSRT